MNVPVTVYSEMTPNPTTMKFVANKYLLPIAESVEFNSKSDSVGFSPLAESLFDFPFVDGVFIASNFITIKKTDNVSWDFITMELREFVKDWLKEGKDVLIAKPLPKEESVKQDKTKLDSFEASQFDDPIRHLLDEYVRPAVENDGGAIDYVGFHEGIVKLVLKGSCAGCPSSTQTLKGGIENLLKQHIPEVQEVVAING